MEANDNARGMILLNELGDVEITWDSNKDDEMRELIARKMAQGVRFFVLKPVLKSAIHRRAKLVKIDDLVETRVRVADEDIAKMFEAGKVGLVRTASADKQQRGEDAPVLTRDPAEAARNRTVAVRAFAGG